MKQFHLSREKSRTQSKLSSPQATRDMFFFFFPRLFLERPKTKVRHSYPSMDAVLVSFRTAKTRTTKVVETLLVSFQNAKGPSCPQGWLGSTMLQLPIGGTVNLNFLSACLKSPLAAVPAGGSASPAGSGVPGLLTNSLGVRAIRLLGFMASSHPLLSNGLQSTSYGTALFG